MSSLRRRGRSTGPSRRSTRSLPKPARWTSAACHSAESRRSPTHRDDGVRRLVVCSAFSHFPTTCGGASSGRRRSSQSSQARSFGVASPRQRRSRGGQQPAARWPASLRTRSRTPARGRRLDLRPRLAFVTSPTLVLCGGDDRHNLPLGRDLAAVLLDARFAVVEGGGMSRTSTRRTRSPRSSTSSCTEKNNGCAPAWRAPAEKTARSGRARRSRAARARE